MRKAAISIILILFVCRAFCSSEVRQIDYLPFENGEKIQYDVYYHWGIIWKKAARGILDIKYSEYDGKVGFKSTLACQTLTFADKILRVRDTLNSYTTLNITPLYYDKIANEGNYQAKDILKYIYPESGDSVGGDITLIRKKRAPWNGVVWSEGKPYDMLSVFYYLRTLEYRSLDLDQVIDIPIFTGRKVIIMKVKYIGRTIVELKNKKSYEAFRLNLNFVNDVNLKDEDPPIDVWLSTDKKRVPLKVEEIGRAHV